MINRTFKYSLTVLNTSIIIAELILIVFTVLNWATLSKGEGWGVVAVIGFGFFIASGLILDFILQLTFKHKILLNLVCFLIVLIYFYLIISNI